jgi:PAS domain-containing protein|eukprot:jgi/Chrpa1/24125/Chrysochromulina_OHIO_Genome00027797-RA
MHSPRNALSPRHVPNAIAELAAAKLQFQNLPVHKRHTTTSAQSYKGDSPQHVLTPSSPRERALERSRLRFEKQARVPFREEESERDRTSRTQVLALTPYLDDAKAQRPEIIAMSNSLAMHHEQLKDKLHTRFKSMGRAFRLMDVDKSNSCDVKEVREGLTRMFNLEHIPDAQMNRLAELMDTSGDGTVRLDEFARFFSTDHRPSSAVDLHRENALRRATRPATSPTRGRFGSPSKSPTKVRFS